MAENEGPDDLEVVTWALDQLLKHHYDYTLDAEGNLETLEMGSKFDPRDWPGGPKLLYIIEGTLKRILDPEEWEALLSLKEERAPEKIEGVLRLLFPIRSDVATRGRQELEGAGWPEILLFLDNEFTEPDPAAERVVDVLVKEREGLSTPFGRDVEGIIEERQPGVLSKLIAGRYIKEVRSLLPRIVKRATLLRLLPARSKVSEHVRRYLVEASRCFIYGQFLASLFLCRSAIISATEDRLLAKGFGRELDALTKDKLKGLLELAHERGVLDDVAWKQADDIRELANDAIHGRRLATEAESKGAFDQTRGILQLLYE